MNLKYDNCVLGGSRTRCYSLTKGHTGQNVSNDGPKAIMEDENETMHRTFKAICILKMKILSPNYDLIWKFW